MKGKTFLMAMGVLFLALTVAILPFIGACAPEEVAPPPEEAPPEEAPPPAPPAPETVKIGAVVSLTGPTEAQGAQTEAGYKIAIEDINRDGGVYVKEFDKKIPLELVSLDSESNAEKAISRVETLISVHEVKVLVGCAQFQAAPHITERDKVAGIAVATASQAVHERGYKYWFTPLGTSPDEAKAMFDLIESIPKAERPTKAVIFEEQTDWGVELSEYFQKELEKRGVYTLTGVHKYSMLAKDYSPLILAAKAAGAEVLLSNPITPDGMTMMRQMKELDYNPKMIVMIRAPDDLPWGMALGPIGDYVILTTGWHNKLPFPGIAELNAEYQAEFGRPADALTGPGYASIQIVVDAIERAGTLDTEKIRDAIVATDMMTVVGQVKFRPNGTPIDPVQPVVQWQNGAQELIWPPEYVTKPLAYPIPKWSER
ncbi:MAG: amino acid ABC transporter substrate-binding protein [Dehalococcoidia bacterium]|nr:amino acid ABC transporter substrate-binding protein [Dehalococcoidia bacterium]